MVMFWPVQQELDCINGQGDILGKIKFDGKQDQYIFCPDSDVVVLSQQERASIEAKLADLGSGKTLIPMQDDD